MAEKELTKNEKRVLYYLVKHPNVSDRIVADKSGSKLSTVTAIKNRLKSQGYFRKIRIPCVYNLGYELFNATVWHVRPEIVKEGVLKDIKARLQDSQSLAGVSVNVMYLLNFSQNYSEINSLITRLERVYLKHGLIDSLDSRDFRLYPFKDSIILAYFDYAPLLAHALGINDRPPKNIIHVKANPEMRLTKVEKRVFHALLSQPTWADTMIARKYNVTRQVVSKLKKRWEYENLIKTVREINLAKFGFEVLEITNMRVQRTDDEKKDARIVSEALDGIRPILSILSGYDLFYIGVHRNFTEYQNTRAAMISFLDQNGYYLDRPSTNLFSLRDSHTIQCDFSNDGLNRALNIDLLDLGLREDVGNRMFR